MVFHWSLSDGKSPQVSKTLLSILTVLNNAIVWMVSTRPPTSKTSSPFINPLVIGQSQSVLLFPIHPVLCQSFDDCTKSTNYNWYNCHLHVPQFFQFPNEFEVLILLFIFFLFYSVVSRDSKVDNFAIIIIIIVF